MKQKPMNFEYKAVYTSGGPMPERELNKYGKDRWELCGVVNSLILTTSTGWPNVSVFIFKRSA